MSIEIQLTGVLLSFPLLSGEATSLRGPVAGEDRIPDTGLSNRG